MLTPKKRAIATSRESVGSHFPSSHRLMTDLPTSSSLASWTPFF